MRTGLHEFRCDPLDVMPRRVGDDMDALLDQIERIKRDDWHGVVEDLVGYQDWINASRSLLGTSAWVVMP